MRMLMVPPMFMCDIHLRLEYHDVLLLAKDLHSNDLDIDVLLEHNRIEPQNIKTRYGELVDELLSRDECRQHFYADDLPPYTYRGCQGQVDKKGSLKRLMKCKSCRDCMVEALCRLSGFK
tara:strand:- start:7434 stop:7793 length:360 start_codon:yes stop_codon:yes gene_type:complete